MQFPSFADTHFQKSERAAPFDSLVAVLFCWAIPQWILPNHITLLRILGAPFVVWGVAFHHYAWAVPLFLVLALTDAIDGTLARTRDQITHWGMMFDPFADKLLIVPVALLVVAVHGGITLACAIAGIEFLTIGVALLWGSQGGEIKANFWGKTKMALQVIGLMCFLLFVWLGAPFREVAVYILWASTFFAAMSLLKKGG